MTTSQLRHAASMILVRRRPSTNVKYSKLDPFQEVLAKATGTHQGGRSQQTPKRDFEVLMIERSARSSMMPGNFAFPGGNFDHAADASDSWITLVSDFFRYPSKYDAVNHLAQFINTRPPRPAVFKAYEKWTQPQDLSEHTDDLTAMHVSKEEVGFMTGMRREGSTLLLAPELAFKNCALRELFEETGLFCYQSGLVGKARVKTAESDEARSSDPTMGARFDLTSFQDKVTSGRVSFDFIYDENGIMPPWTNCIEWSNWVTPTTFKLRQRYDTVFYLLRVDQCPSPILPDTNEISSFKWVDPEVALRDCYEGKFAIAPPQIYELARLANFDKIAALEEFARKRSERNGMVQIFPFIFTTSDGIQLVVFPGDDLYPKDITNLMTQSDVPPSKIKLSLAEARKCSSVHRVEVVRDKNGKWLQPKILINIKLGDGHIQPISSFS